MSFKLDIGDPKSKKTFHIETSSEIFIGKKIGDTVLGSKVKELPDDYEFLITGASDSSGFPALAFVEGGSKKRVLLTRGKGLRKVRKKKKLRKPVKGLRLRKTVHGNTIADDISQINLKVIKQGAKPLEEIFGKEEKKAEETKVESEKSGKENEKKEKPIERPTNPEKKPEKPEEKKTEKKEIQEKEEKAKENPKEEIKETKELETKEIKPETKEEKAFEKSKETKEEQKETKEETEESEKRETK